MRGLDIMFYFQVVPLVTYRGRVWGGGGRQTERQRETEGDRQTERGRQTGRDKQAERQR